MASHNDITIEITPQVLLKAYSCGIFPMAESADDPALYWIEPQARGILPLEAVHIPRRLAKAGRRSTWINARIRSLYGALFAQGYCHTVEAWRDGRMVGGLYGVALGGAFFGESMFSTERDASKVALVYLCARLAYGGFTLLDTQFVTDHLRQFGTIEVERQEFHRLLEPALARDADFHALSAEAPPDQILAILRADALHH